MGIQRQLLGWGPMSVNGYGYGLLVRAVASQIYKVTLRQARPLTSCWEYLRFWVPICTFRGCRETFFCFQKLFYYSMRMGVLHRCMPIHCVHASCIGKAKQDARAPGNGATDTCEPPHGCWELNPKLVPLPTEPSFQLHNHWRH